MASATAPDDSDDALRALGEIFGVSETDGPVGVGQRSTADPDTLAACRLKRGG